MLSRPNFHFIDRTLQDVCSNKRPLGDKVIIFGADWKQNAPVVENGNRDAQVNESIKLDPLFKDNFEILRFILYKCLFIFI